ncbi:Imm43 family immunity protein [Pseudomonas aegrilactucae]|uniref:Immunity protein 43 domain-containing protein n=1 Tax=Pseudomonas aegrilactucae TaxID=2854028 RepID=A0A9Q3AGF8_9PSED|nr:hypothetical protein [Pseudomonas aegrilactucae]MBV6290464.1 hypothetical protein [Pseudomonas aegrilactucae]
MNYYVLSQKEGPGCQLGMLDAALYDKFYTDAEAVRYGQFPWYKRAWGESGRLFPEGGVLICKDEYYDFDIRGASDFFYIVSDPFLAVCQALNVEIVDCAKIQVVSQSGKQISKNRYNAVFFNELNARKDSDPSSTFMEKENGRPFRIKKLVLPAKLDLDLFKYGGMISGSSSLICSERFKELAKDFKGINYTPLDTVLWSGIRAI